MAIAWTMSDHEAELSERAALRGDAPRALLHRLNNQLGVILAHAELIEAKAQDPAERSRAGQVVGAALKAIAVSRELSDAIDA